MVFLQKTCGRLEASGKVWRPYSWAIYNNDLSRGHPNWWFSKRSHAKMALIQVTWNQIIVWCMYLKPFWAKFNWTKSFFLRRCFVCPKIAGSKLYQQVSVFKTNMLMVSTSSRYGLLSIPLELVSLELEARVWCVERQRQPATLVLSWRNWQTLWGQNRF